MEMCKICPGLRSGQLGQIGPTVVAWRDKMPGNVHGSAMTTVATGLGIDRRELEAGNVLMDSMRKLLDIIAIATYFRLSNNCANAINSATQPLNPMGKVEVSKRISTMVINHQFQPFQIVVERRWWGRPVTHC